MLFTGMLVTEIREVGSRGNLPPELSGCHPSTARASTHADDVLTEVWGVLHSSDNSEELDSNGPALLRKVPGQRAPVVSTSSPMKEIQNALSTRAVKLIGTSLNTIFGDVSAAL
jgi:hypothetical protein